MNKALSLSKKTAASIWKGLAPSSYAQYRFNSLSLKFHEPELHLLPFLCDSQKTSLDIGASEGLYTAHLLKLSAQCVAFEPRPLQAAALKSALARLKARASVESVALSDVAGEANLRILVEDPGRSTIEVSNPLQDEDGSPGTEVTVQVRRLDDFVFGNVGFIKVDVEGHELAVLRGGEQTIRQNRPSLLIEIEDRHKENAIEDVTKFITALDYCGFFLMGKKVCPLNQFDKAIHQDSSNIGGWKSHWERKGVYINNFIFLPLERQQSFLRCATDQGWQATHDKSPTVLNYRDSYNSPA